MRLSADYVVLAHNQDDQVETLLLQLLRGAGLKGLAAMPIMSVRPELRRSMNDGPSTALRSAQGELNLASSGRAKSAVRPDVRAELVEARKSGAPTVLRPLLDVPRKDIEAYARKRGLAWIEDETNSETYFLRNFLRHEVFPLIATRYPSYRTTLARSARHFADAVQILDERAAGDAAHAIAEGALSVAPLRCLPPARARNLLRYFLSSHALPMPAADRLDEALRQLIQGSRDSRVAIDLGAAELRRYAGRVHVVPKEPRLAATFSRRWQGEEEIALPELGGVLVFERGRGNGISLARLRTAPVSIGMRRGGERLQPDCRRPRRTLKNLLQEAQIPPWRRDRTPLLFCGVELVWAADLGVDCAYQSAPGEPALRPHWLLRAVDSK